MDPTAQDLLEQFRAALARSAGRRPVLLQLVYPDGTLEQHTLLPPARTAGAARRSDTEEDILAVLGRAERPLKGSAIASRAGRRYTSHFRESLARLRADGTVLRDGGGLYRLAGPGSAARGGGQGGG